MRGRIEKMQRKIRKVFAILAVFAIFLSVIVISRPIAWADTEPNDSFAQAELITPGTYTGTVDDTTDLDDYYQITVSAGQTIDANVTPASTLRVWFGLYDPDQSQVASDSPNAGVMAKVSWTTNSAQASYTYYFWIEAYPGSGEYTLKVSLISQNDGNSGGDAGDTFDTATQLTSTNATYSGFVKDLDVDDYYKVTVTAGQTISVNATPASTLKVWLGLYDTARDQMISDSPNQGVMAKVSWTTNSAQASYTYYFWIEAYPGYGTYSMAVSLVSQNDGNSGGDAGDTFDTATQLTSTNATYPGLLRDLDVDDYYKVTLTAGQTLSVNVTPVSSLKVWLGLYNPARNEVVSDVPNKGLMAKVSWTTNSAQTSYTYYVVVEADDGFGNYSMASSIVSQNDAASGGDAGDALDTATPMTTGTFYGLLKDEDTNDCFRLVQNVTAGQSLYVTVIPSAGQALSVYVYDEARNQKTYGTANPGVAVVLSTKAAITRIFYIKVTSTTSYGNYTMRVTAEPYIGVPTYKPTNPNLGQSVKVSVSVTASQNGIGPVTLSYSTGASWTNVTMLLNTTTSLYEGTIPGFQSVTTVYYKVIGYDTAGDYFVQDNAGLNYAYPVVPELSTLTMMLFLVCSGAPLAVLLRRRNRH
jgi:hypothetical protein